MTTHSMKDHVRKILAEIGEDPDREGLKGTPYRVDQALRYLTKGYAQDVDKILNKALFNVKYDEMVIVTDIDFFSLCEHHLVPFFGKCHVACLPDKKVIGFSKADLSRPGAEVLSIEGVALHRQPDGTWELFISSEKDRPYPTGYGNYQKAGTGVWSIDRLTATTTGCRRSRRSCRSGRRPWAPSC